MWRALLILAPAAIGCASSTNRDSTKTSRSTAEVRADLAPPELAITDVGATHRPPLPAPSTGVPSVPMQVCGNLDAEVPAYRFNSASKRDFPVAHSLPRHLPGSFELRLLGEGDRVLSRTLFGPMLAHAGRVGPDGAMVHSEEVVEFFCLLVPWVEGGRAVVVTHDGKELARLSGSEHPPAVRFTSPRPGARWPGRGRKLSVSWEGSDPDAEPTLRYSLYYRSGPGDTGTAPWTVVFGDAELTSFAIDGEVFPTGASPELLVVVNDGFWNGQATMSLAAAR